MNSNYGSQSPLVSVCIDIFNYAEYLPEAIESVIAQKFSDWELIIVDDKSSDRSFEIAQEYATRDSRIRALQNPVNLGMVRNRNACLREARGKYIKCLHADDFLASQDALQVMVELMEAHPALSLVASAMLFVDSNSKPVQQVCHFQSGRFLAGTTVITQCLWQQKNLIGGPSAVMFRRELASRGFDENYFHAADLEMWFHLLEKGAFAYIPQPLTAYRLHQNQQTEKDKCTLSAAQDRLGIYRTYLSKKEFRLRGWIKSLMMLQSIKRLARRSRALGLNKSAAKQAIAEFGAVRYYALLPCLTLWHCARQFKPIARLVAPYVPDEIQHNRQHSNGTYPPGINIAGMVKGEYGVGESSRAYCRANEQSGIPNGVQNVLAKSHRNQDDSIRLNGSGNPYSVNLMTFSFDYARRFYKDNGRRFFEGHRNIALWYWELEKFPTQFHGNFDYYDEIWTPTEFCRAAFAAVSPVPVHKITYPLLSADTVKPDRAKFGLPVDACVFLFSFDYCSTTARKNPLAIVAAFEKAFTKNEKAILVIKAINPHDDPVGANLIKQAMARVNGMQFEVHLSASELDTLIATCDCYVSLHRSEGLGLGMAQAMNLGRPVIATGYSGNLEFMTQDNSLLVRYKLVSNPKAVASYAQECIWAEADIDHAAEYMRWVFENRDQAAQLGLRAQKEIRANLNPARTVEQIKARLNI